MHANREQRQRIHRVHPLSLRLLFLRTRRRRPYLTALAWLLLLALLGGLVPYAMAAGLARTEAVSVPTSTAGAHRDECRHRVLQTLNGKIESEDLVDRVDQEYFRYVVRRDLREIMLICDARTGSIRSEIDLWGGL